MPFRTIRSLLLIVALLGLGASACLAQNPEVAPGESPISRRVDSAKVWHDVRVVDTYNWSHTHVSLRWVGGGKALEMVREDGAAKTMVPDLIRYIYDSEGRDITAEVASARDSGSQPSYDQVQPRIREEGAGNEINEIRRAHPPLGRPLAEIVTPQLFQIAFDASLGYATKTGSWFAGLDDGVNWQVGARFMVSQRNYLKLGFRSQDLGVQLIEIYDFEPYTLRSEIDLREYLIMLGRHSPLVENKPVKSVGYFEFGISVMEHRFRVDGWNSEDTITKMGLALQGGLLLLLDDSFAADLSVSATWKAGNSGNEGGGLLLGVHAGLAIFI